MRAHHQKRINLALQGGGAHGAFTWGVLDRLFEDDRLWIEAISGTSAGAMNAVVAAQGMYDGQAEGARRALHAFWFGVSQSAKASPIKRGPLDILFGNWSLDSSPSYLFFDMMQRLASPYDINPLDINPLRDLLARLVDFDKCQWRRNNRPLRRRDNRPFSATSGRGALSGDLGQRALRALL